MNMSDDIYAPGFPESLKPKTKGKPLTNEERKARAKREENEQSMIAELASKQQREEHLRFIAAQYGEEAVGKAMEREKQRAEQATKEQEERVKENQRIIDEQNSLALRALKSRNLRISLENKPLAVKKMSDLKCPECSHQLFALQELTIYLGKYIYSQKKWSTNDGFQDIHLDQIDLVPRIINGYIPCPNCKFISKLQALATPEG